MTPAIYRSCNKSTELRVTTPGAQGDTELLQTPLCWQTRLCINDGIIYISVKLMPKCPPNF